MIFRQLETAKTREVTLSGRLYLGALPSPVSPLIDREKAMKPGFDCVEAHRAHGARVLGFRSCYAVPWFLRIIEMPRFDRTGSTLAGPTAVTVF
jgi:hypothetical protein